MAKKETGAAKKSAIPYTPEVTPPPAKAAAPPPAAPKAAKSAKTVAAPATVPSPVVTPRVAASTDSPAAAKPKRASTPITWELISERAYYISISGTGGDEHHNWLRAEAELRREAEEA